MLFYFITLFFTSFWVRNSVRNITVLALWRLLFTLMSGFPGIARSPWYDAPTWAVSILPVFFAALTSGHRKMVISTGC